MKFDGANQSVSIRIQLDTSPAQSGFIDVKFKSSFCSTQVAQQRAFRLAGSSTTILVAKGGEKLVVYVNSNLVVDSKLTGCRKSDLTGKKLFVIFVLEHVFKNTSSFLQTIHLAVNSQII